MSVDGRIRTRPMLMYTYSTLYTLLEKDHVSVKIVTLTANVTVSSTIPCYSKHFLYKWRQ